MSNENKKLRVLVFGSDGSATSMSSKLAKRSIEYGEQIDKYAIIAPGLKNEKKILSDKVTAYNVKVRKIHSFVCRFFSLIKIYNLAKELIQKEGYNVISTQDPFEQAFVALLLKKRFKIGVNMQEHGDFFSRTYWRDENIINFFRYYLGIFNIKRADSIRAVSNRIKNTLIQRFGIKSEKIIVVPIYIDIIKGKEARISVDLKKIYPNKFIFLTMGRFEKQKNIPHMIWSFKKASEEIDNSILIIAGKGGLKNEFKKLVSDLELKEKIIFIDWVDDVYSYYKTADAYVLSSNYEGWGMVIIEAASAGLPIIMTDVGCAHEVIENGKGGIIVPIGDRERLASAMIEVFKNEQMRDIFSEEGMASLKKLNDKNKTLQLYRESWQKAFCEED